jgi:hypothetical protein
MRACKHAHTHTPSTHTPREQAPAVAEAAPKSAAAEAPGAKAAGPRRATPSKRVFVPKPLPEAIGVSARVKDTTVPKVLAGYLAQSLRTHPLVSGPSLGYDRGALIQPRHSWGGGGGGGRLPASCGTHGLRLHGPTVGSLLEPPWPNVLGLVVGRPQATPMAVGAS